MLRHLYTRILLAIVLISSVASAAADQTITVALQRKVELHLNTGIVDLGLPIGPERSRIFERQNAVTVSFRCNVRTPWEVRLSGTDFSNGSHSIPITQLRWKKASSDYLQMLPVGSYTVVASELDYPGRGGNWHDETISYRLELTGDEYEGTYAAVLTYTLFVQ